MTVQTCMALRFAYLPGFADYLEEMANCAGNLAIFGAAKGVKNLRNLMYGSAAFTVACVAGALLCTAPAAVVTFSSLAVGGVFITAYSAKKAFEKAQDLVRWGCRIN